MQSRRVAVTAQPTVAEHAVSSETGIARALERVVRVSASGVRVAVVQVLGALVQIEI